jgi:Fungal specific transcription factor domain
MRLIRRHRSIPRCNKGPKQPGCAITVYVHCREPLPLEDADLSALMAHTDSAKIGSTAGPAETSTHRAAPLRRTVCDHCRRRRMLKSSCVSNTTSLWRIHYAFASSHRLNEHGPESQLANNICLGIRCDGELPCRQCLNASLTCKRDHVPKKRGPKRGHGRVINELRAREAQEQLLPDVDLESPTECATSPPYQALSVLMGPRLDIAMLSDMETSLSSNVSPASTPPQFNWSSVTSNPATSTHAPAAPEPNGIFTSDEFQPRIRNYLHLVPQCIDLYYEHIYPIMPLIYMPSIRVIISRPMTVPEKNLIYSLCALTAMHMSGKSIEAPGPPSWETVGRFFLDECISARQSYDFIDDLSLSSVISSFYLSTSFFEINQSRKSWYYLREALTTALDLGLHDDSSYFGLSQEELLCRQRVFWILFVTER